VQTLRGWAYRHSPHLALAVGFLVLAALGALLLLWPWGSALRTQPGGGAMPVAAPRTLLLVYVSGAVAEPGIYRLDAGLRVRDAVEAAGGLTPGVDRERLPNLAAHLRDGRQVHVPFARTPGLRGGTRAQAPRTDINTADPRELERVPGIDAALAAAIVEHRQTYGPFLRLGELKSALGIDERLFRQLRRYLVAE
jgi:competence protein ComEA